MRKRFHLLLTFFFLLLVGCGAVEVSVEATVPAGALDTVASATPTAVPATATAVPATATTVPATATATPRPPTATPSPPPATATSTGADRPATYQVAFVPAEDRLNVRATPDPEAEILGTLAMPADEIAVMDEGEQVGENIWRPIRVGRLSGWVNDLYLTEAVPADAFCDDEATENLVEGFREALADEDEEALAEMVDPQRGLRVRVSWWNPEVWLRGEETERLLSDDTVYEWGVEDGSGDAIEGSFREVIWPMFERDLLPAEEIACNEILHGGTAGIIQLPEAYEGVNFYSFYRPPGPNQVEMDWGTWVVGVERWQGAYRLAFLVHFAWEI